MRHPNEVVIVGFCPDKCGGWVHLMREDPTNMAEVQANALSVADGIKAGRVYARFTPDVYANMPACVYAAGKARRAKVAKRNARRRHQ